MTNKKRTYRIPVIDRATFIDSDFTAELGRRAALFRAGETRGHGIEAWIN